MNEAKSTHPQLPPLDDESAIAPYPKAPPVYVLKEACNCRERQLLSALAENVSLKAKLKMAGICELAVDNPNLASYAKEWESRAEKAEAERDQALEVIREYRLSSISHRLCSIDFGCCPTCIQADALLARKTKET